MGDGFSGVWRGGFRRAGRVVLLRGDSGYLGFAKAREAVEGMFLAVNGLRRVDMEVFRCLWGLAEGGSVRLTGPALDAVCVGAGCSRDTARGSVKRLACCGALRVVGDGVAGFHVLSGLGAAPYGDDWGWPAGLVGYGITVEGVFGKGVSGKGVLGE